MLPLLLYYASNMTHAKWGNIFIFLKQSHILYNVNFLRQLRNKRKPFLAQCIYYHPFKCVRCLLASIQLLCCLICVGERGCSSQYKPSPDGPWLRCENRWPHTRSWGSKRAGCCCGVRSWRSQEAKSRCSLSGSLPQRFTVVVICGFQGTSAGKLEDCGGWVKQLVSGVAWNNLAWDIKRLSRDPGCKRKAESSSDAVSKEWRMPRKETGDRREAPLEIQALCAAWVMWTALPFLREQVLSEKGCVGE